MKPSIQMSAALCLCAAYQQVDASTISYDWGEVTVTGTTARANLKLGDGSGVPIVSESQQGDETADAEINIARNQTTGNEFQILSQQKGNSDARLDYAGQWFDDPPTNTVYTGRTQITYDLTNSGDAGLLLYNFRIEDTVLKLFAGGEETRSPFDLGESGPNGVGVQLSHLVLVDNQILSDKGLEFWTYNFDVGQYESELRFDIRQNGLSASTSPLIQRAGDEFETYGWMATVDKDYTVSLGTFDQGETKEVMVQMGMRIIHGTEAEFDVQYVDPGTFAGRFSNTAASVPLPATGWLMIAGLAGLGSLARRGKRRSA